MADNGKTAAVVSLEQDEQFLKKAYGRALIPCILSILSGNINILADGILVGQRLGTDALAAINYSLPVYLVLCIAGSFLVSGTAICASEAIGDNKRKSTDHKDQRNAHKSTARGGKYSRRDDAQTLYHMAVLWCTLVSAVITAAGLLLLEPITGFLCADAQVAALAADYIGVTAAGALPKILIYIPFWYLRLDGRNEQVTVMMVVMGAGNVLLDLIFLFVFDLGVFGAGLASVLATTAACLLGFWRLCDKKSSFSFGIAFTCRRFSLRRIAEAGSPSAMNNLFQTLRVMAVNAMLQKYGGSQMVAAFTAVNCICAFEESVTCGVPQAASAMLGIYSGEHDNGSARLLLKREIKSGVPYCVLFSAVVLAASDFIAKAYGLSVPLGPAFGCMAAGMVPALLNCMLSGYYNVSGHILWANVIIFLRVFLMSCAGLWLLLRLEMNPWLFLLLGELLTILVWFTVTGISHRLHPDKSRFLLMDDSLEKTGRVINFSVKGDDEAICDASSRITGFCEENGMVPRQVMRISLAMEEIMTLITSQNGDRKVEFDLRVYALQGVIGIRIRYSGKDFNPLCYSQEEISDLYMGIKMIEDMVEETMYQRTFGMNTLQIII